MFPQIGEKDLPPRGVEGDAPYIIAVYPISPKETDNA